jgi:hypothetical protein
VCSSHDLEDTDSSHDRDNIKVALLSDSLFVREHGVHAGPKDYFVVVVVVVIRGSI